MAPCWFFVAMLAPMVLALEQSPDTVIRQGQSVSLSCSKKKSTSRYVFWYKVPLGKDSRLILMASAVEGGKADVEEDLRTRLKSSGIQGDTMTISIEHAFLNDSGTYYCAEDDRDRSALNLIFGNGTKLTVMGKNDEIIPPSVAIFSPSKQEIQQKSKATLVCLASGFYPDHLNLFWKVNGAKRREGVGTDEFSTKNGSTYSLTSRLRISAEEWFNPLNRFECVAKFFKNGTLESIHKLINGDAGCAVTEGTYLWYGNSLKLTYLILCGKALVYAVLVSSLVWTAKGGGKLYRE